MCDEKMTITEKWPPVEGTADYFGFYKEIVYRWIEKMEIQSHCMGKVWRFKTFELDQWIAAGKVKEGPASELKNCEIF